MSNENLDERIVKKIKIIGKKNEATKEQINSVVASVKKRLGKSTAYTGDYVPQAQDYGSSCCPPSNVQQEVKALPQLDTKKFGGTTKGFGKPSESNVDILQKLK